MSAADFYGKQQQQPQGQYYPPQGPPGQQGGYYGSPQYPQQTYQPQPAPYPQPQTVYVQQAPPKGGGNSGCMACLAGMCLCCCAEEICDCIF